MNAVQEAIDPRVTKALALVREAIDELATKPDDGTLWKAKLALLDAMQWLVRARQEGG